jgi:hypothetical protein
MILVLTFVLCVLFTVHLFSCTRTENRDGDISRSVRIFIVAAATTKHKESSLYRYTEGGVSNNLGPFIQVPVLVLTKYRYGTVPKYRTYVLVHNHRPKSQAFCCLLVTALHVCLCLNRRRSNVKRRHCCGVRSLIYSVCCLSSLLII